MNRKILLAAVFILAAALLSGCREYDPLGDITDVLGVDVYRAEMLHSQDSHGGFLGDGLLAVSFQFSAEEAKELPEQLADQTGWHPFPLSENVETALYGKTTANSTRNALIRDYSTDELLVPEIENGWYFFYDRHSGVKDPLDDSQLFSRGSYNCTVAVFDTDTGILYFFEIDT